MTITAGLAAELAMLSEALGDPDVDPAPDLAETIRQLAVDARAVVSSYLGLSVLVTAHELAFRFTVLDDGVHTGDVQTSLKLPLPAPTPTPAVAPPTAVAPDGANIAVILYAATPGAFVDLGADLAFLTGYPLSTIELDQHVSVAAEADTTGALQAASKVSEAVGVLIARGHTPEQAHHELDTFAADAGTDRHAAAELLLAGLTVTGPDLHPSPPGAPSPPLL